MGMSVSPCSMGVPADEEVEADAIEAEEPEAEEEAAEEEAAEEAEAGAYTRSRFSST